MMVAINYCFTQTIDFEFEHGRQSEHGIKSNIFFMRDVMNTQSYLILRVTLVHNDPINTRM